MTKLLAALMLFYTVSAHAVLTCYNASLGTNSTWTLGNQWLGADVIYEYCWANGAELQYIQTHFTGLRGRIGGNVNGGQPITVWTDQSDVNFIAENL